MLWIVWVAIFIICLLAEAITPQLTTVWFSLGSLVALIVYFIVPEMIWLQIVCFIVVTAIAIIFTRKAARRFLRGRVQPTNADRCLGAEAVVIEDINNIQGLGQVKVKGEVWSAKSQNNEIIEKDSIVRIEKIEGVKVIVAKI
ncbi:MAG: NfeD family protein [Ruminococcaceae bacterium]|nr:NfeD family protein [Oscillospiraceae bacterium]